MDRQAKHIRCVFLSLLLLSSFVGTAMAERVVVTSGRVVYDAFGRVIATYHPTVDDSVYGDSVDCYSNAVDAVAPTRTEYDVLDRTVKVIYPDETETNTRYFVEGRALVTRVTDALGHTSDTHVTASGRTLKSVRYNSAGVTNAITTQYAYDGLGRLVSVTDAEGNVTSSVYDMGDRRVSVTHPASGETRFTYDALGNVLTRQTANLRDSALFIEYGYDRGRLVSVSYPEHHENDVHYYYGGVNDPDHAKGRLCFRRDATGGEQYAYDNLGNVKRTLRTVTVPNEDVGTFLTEFEYDSFGKLLSMTYPDGEKVCYWYDGSGQLSEIYVRERKNGYRYVQQIGYDRFGDRVYIRYGNGAETEYAYDDRMRRLETMSLSSSGATLERSYGYDDVGNITSLENTGTNLLYTPVSHTYGYDDLYRLTSATGNAGDAQNRYTLAMTYDKMYRVKSKKQHVWQSGIQFEGTLVSGYELGYSYSTAAGRKFQMQEVSDRNFRTDNPHAVGYVNERHRYAYDANGNIVHVNTARKKSDGKYRDLTHEEQFRWDEENRLMAISQDGYVSNYWYDGDGQRVIKEHGGNQAVFVNSRQDRVLTDTRRFTIYPSAYMTVHDGGLYTKHVYIGTERISSRMGSMLDALSASFEENDLAGQNVFTDIDYDGQCDSMSLVMMSNYDYFGLPYNGENRHAEEGEEMVSTQPRGGDLASDSPRHYWMMADGYDGGDGNGDAEGGEGGGPSRGPSRASNVDYNGNRYFYHSDHLGSSSLITDATGGITQQLDYLPYGEVFLEKRHNSDPNQPFYATPYKFNGKELDEETGLYYYGARYMNPRLSIWYGTDPMEEMNPYMSSYLCCAGNPVRFIDLTGMIWDDIKNVEKLKGNINKVINSLENDVNKYKTEIEKGNLKEKKIKQLNNKITEAQNRISNLKQSLSDIKLLGDDSNTYVLKKAHDNRHHVFLDSNGKVNIETSSDDLSIHEITHVRQSLNSKDKKLKFNKDGYLLNPGSNLGKKLNNEVEAYQMQYSLKTNSFPGILGGKGLSGINDASVANIIDESGHFVYPELKKYYDDLQKFRKEQNKLLNNN